MIRNLVILLLGLLVIFSPKLLPTSDPSWIVPENELGLVVVDVGAEGDAQLVVSPNKKSMLIDTGDSSERVAWPNLERVLVDNKISELDILVITHPHQDHIGNVMEVLTKFKPKVVLLTGVIHTNQTYEAMLTYIRDNNIRALQVQVGQEVDFAPDVKVEVLGPVDLSASNINNTSIIVKISYGKFSAIITSDAEVEEEKQQLAIAQDKLPSTVLKAGHHGSKTSSSLEYLQAVDPELVIISAGSNNQFGHPHEETLERLESLGINTLVTRDRGTITIVSDGESYEIRSSR